MTRTRVFLFALAILFSTNVNAKAKSSLTLEELEQILESVVGRNYVYPPSTPTQSTPATPTTTHSTLLHSTAYIPTPPPTHYVKDVVIVTDVGIGLRSKPCGNWADVDDGYAIHSILHEKYVSIAAIVVQFGNAINVDDMYDKLWILVHKMNLPHVPVLIRGSRSELNSTPSNILQQIQENAKFIKFVEDYPRQLTIIGIGPATSIAVLMEHPVSAAKVERIYLEMGQYGHWGEDCGFSLCDKRVGDFNFKSDVEAANRLIQLCPEKLLFIPFQMILDITLDRRGLDEYFGGTEAERWMARNTENWFEQWTHVFNCEEYIHLWDTTPLLVGSGIKKPHFCDFVQTSAGVEMCVRPNGDMTHRLALSDDLMGLSSSWVCDN